MPGRAGFFRNVILFTSTQPCEVDMIIHSLWGSERSHDLSKITQLESVKPRWELTSNSRARSFDLHTFRN